MNHSDATTRSSLTIKISKSTSASDIMQSMHDHFAEEPSSLVKTSKSIAVQQRVKVSRQSESLFTLGS